MAEQKIHHPVKRKAKRLWNYADLDYAYQCAADFLENEEWPEDDGGAQVAAYKEAAKRIRRMANRLLVSRNS